LQETPADKLMPTLVECIGRDNLGKESELKTLVAAAALANARTFGGQDYIGYHTLMALVPAYEMALTLPEATPRPSCFQRCSTATPTAFRARAQRKSEILTKWAGRNSPKQGQR